jgi:glycosyltransferase involved in cell wall biosynthesis
MTFPYISWVLPVHHSKPDQLAESLQSIITQTYTHWELIIVADGLTEEERAIIETARAEAEPRKVTLIDNTYHIGLARSLNVGVAKARGTYIARMDADDICYPERLYKQVQFMELHPDVGICGTAVYHIVNGFGKNVVYPVDHASIISMMMMWGCAIVHPSALIRTEFIRQIPGPYDDSEFNFAEDYYLWIRCIGKTTFHNMEEPLLTYRSDGTNICAVNSDIQQQQISELRGRTADAVGLPRQGNDPIIPWLHKLHAVNTKIPEDSFNHILAEVFYNECLHDAAAKGLQSWNQFWNSPLHIYLPMPLLKQLKFFGACLLKKKFSRV